MSAAVSLTEAIEPQPAALSPGGRFYRPELDALRFFAFFCVFVHHGPRPWLDPDGAGWHIVARKLLILVEETGAFGMAMFFFLSAFLITELLQREKLQTGTVHLKAFYMRRILRIWPLYFGFVALCVVLSWLLPAVYPLSFQRVSAFLLLSGNWYIAAHGVTGSPITPLWSISLEEQFYLLWPLLCKFGGSAGVLFGSLILIPVAFVNMYLCSSRFGVTTWWNSFVHFLFFAAGALLALTLRGRNFSLRPLLRFYSFGAGVACWLLSERLTGMKRPGDPLVPTIPVSAGYLLITLGCVLIFLAFYGAPNRMFPRWLTYLGKISYGLYVFHEGFYLLTYWFDFGSTRTAFLGRILIAFALSVPTAILSYEYFEKPFLRLKERFTFVPSRAA